VGPGTQRFGKRFAGACHRLRQFDRLRRLRPIIRDCETSQDRAGRFSTELFERYQRSQKVTERGTPHSELLAVLHNYPITRQSQRFFR
jgi:hypothetical protein